MSKQKKNDSKVCQVIDGPKGKITCAFIYGSTQNVTGTIRPGETVLKFDEREEVGGRYSNIFWHDATWWLHSSFLEDK
jgi:hypothetical protein